MELNKVMKHDSSGKFYFVEVIEEEGCDDP